MTRLHLSLLGGFEARLEHASPLTFRTQKAQALLAYLAVRAGQPHRRDKLAALLWGAMREEQARTSLRQALYDLRKNLGGAAEILRTEGETVSLDSAAVELDVTTFTRIAGEETPEALEQAALLYRGDLLEGFGVDEEPFEAWLMEERERLRDLAIDTLARALAHQRGGEPMPRDSKLVLIACYLAMFAVGENSTAIMAALPAMSSSLGLGPKTVEWAVNAYLLAAAAFIILGGKAADGFGPRRSSAAGIALFALASLIIALAPDGVVVVAARALQGLGAAFAVAGTLAAVAAAAPEAGRAGAIGAWTGFLMLGFSIGPLVGGVVTHYAGWRINFWLNLLAMLPGGAGARAASRNRSSAENSRGLARARPARLFHGDAHLGAARVVHRRFRALGRHCATRTGSDGLRRAALGGDT